MHINKKLLTTFLFVLLVGVGYVGVQFFHPALFAERENPNNQFWKVPPVDPALKAELAKPRFSGEIGGMFIAPEGTPIPEKYTTFDDLCSERKSWTVSDDQAGALTLNLDLPEKYVYDEGSVSNGTIACDGGVTGSVKSYIYTLSNGDTANIFISRSYLNHGTIDVASDRVSLQKIAGRDVIIVNTVTEDGYWDHAYAYFREPFGMTSIGVSQLPRSEFMKLVRLVASATRTQ